MVLICLPLAQIETKDNRGFACRAGTVPDVGHIAS